MNKVIPIKSDNGYEGCRYCEYRRPETQYVCDSCEDESHFEPSEDFEEEEMAA